MRVLVVEDNPKLAAAIQSGLRSHGYAADVAHLGFEGEDLATRDGGVYDVILLDLMLPDRDGLDVCKSIRRRGVSSRVLMLTALHSVVDKVAGLDAGADDYLTKPFDFDELLARVRSLQRRGDEPGSRHLKVGDLELDLYARVVRRGGKPIALLNKEFGILELLMRNPDRALSRVQIGQKVWDMNFEPQSNVVDAHISSLRKKLQQDGRPQIIHTFQGVGYQLVSTTDVG